MTTFLLCHGAWSGGWAWTRVARILRRAGHEVFTPTYTGLGERSHLLTRDVDLQTHIDDIRSVIRWERLEDFVLVGHSYGDMVITGVADKEWGRISRLVYLDAFVPMDGQALGDLAGAERRTAMADLAARAGDGWLVPRPQGSISPDLPDDDRRWLEDLGTPHPLACFTQPVAVDGNHLKIADKVYVLATVNPGSPFPAIAETTRRRAGWDTRELPTHHHLQLSMPEEVAEILMSGGSGA